jgi:hypothetical protein
MGEQDNGGGSGFVAASQLFSGKKGKYKMSLLSNY